MKNNLFGDFFEDPEGRFWLRFLVFFCLIIIFLLIFFVPDINKRAEEKEAVALNFFEQIKKTQNEEDEKTFSFVVYAYTGTSVNYEGKEEEVTFFTKDEPLKKDTCFIKAVTQSLEANLIVFKALKNNGGRIVWITVKEPSFQDFKEGRVRIVF